MEVLEAKKFFIDRIVAQAVKEGIPLDSLETKILHFTETGVDACQEYLDVSQKFDQAHDMEEFEKRIGNLLVNAYESETQQAKGLGRLEEARESFRQAYATLKKEDHYILVMIDQSLGSRLRSKFLGLF